MQAADLRPVTLQSLDQRSDGLLPLPHQKPLRVEPDGKSRVVKRRDLIAQGDAVGPRGRADAIRS